MTLQRWMRQGQGAAASSSALTSFTQMQTRVLVHKSPCTHESLSTRVLHSGPGEKTSNAIKDTQVATSLPSNTPKQLSMSCLHGLPPFQNLPCRLGCPQRKTKVCNLEFCFNHTFLFMLDGPAEQFSALKTH